MSVSRENKEALNVTDNTRNIIFKRASEKVLLEEGSTIVKGRVITADTIWGLSTWNGGLWDGTYTNSANIIRIVNVNDIFYEHFCDEDLKIATTGTWDTTNQRLVLADTQEATGYYYINLTNIFNANFILSGNISNAILYLSSDGTNYEQVTSNTQHEFTNIGQTGKWKIVASGDTVTANLINIQYNR